LEAYNASVDRTVLLIPAWITEVGAFRLYAPPANEFDVSGWRHRHYYADKNLLMERQWFCCSFASAIPQRSASRAWEKLSTPRGLQNDRI